MAVHTLNLKDGSTVDVEAPLDTPVSELLVLANRKKLFTTPESTQVRDRDIAQRLAAFDKPPAEVAPTRDENDGTALGRGISRGIDSLQQNLGSAVEGIGGILGLDGLEKYGADVALANEAELQAAERNATRRQDVEGVGTGASYVGELVGESAPQMGVVAAGSAAGAAYGAGAGAAFFGIGAVPGALIGGAIGGGLAAFPLFFGGNRERQKDAIDRGERVEISESAAALAAIPQAALDSILTAFVGAKFFAKPGLDIAGGLFTRSVKGAAKGVVTEVPTEIGQAILERGQAGLSIIDEEAMAEYGEAAIAAGILGGGIGGVSGAAQRSGTPEELLQITDQSGDTEAESGIAGLLPSPAMAKRNVGKKAVEQFRAWETANPEEAVKLDDAGRTTKIKEFYDVLDVKPESDKYVPSGLQVTGPQDLGVQLDAGTGEATTRDQRVVAADEQREDAAETKGIETLLETDRVEALKTYRFTKKDREKIAKKKAEAATEADKVKVEADKVDQELDEMLRATADDATVAVRKGRAKQIETDTDSLIAELEQADSVANEQIIAALKEESGLETATGKIDTDRAKQSEATRTKILQDTVANAGEVKQSAPLQRAFESALAAEGIGKATATPAEVASIKKASNLILNKDLTPLVEPAVITEVAELKDPRQQVMEDKVAPKPIEEIQASFPGLGRKRELGTPPAQETTAETTVEPKIVDVALFDKLGVPPSAPIRKRVMGKDLNDTGVRQEFATLAGNKNTSNKVKTNINRMLADTPEAQLDLPLSAKPKGKPDVKTAKTKSEPSRDSVSIDKQDVGAESKGAVPSTTTTTERTKRTEPPRDSRVGSPVVELRPASRTTTGKPTSLETDKQVVRGSEKPKDPTKDFTRLATPTFPELTSLTPYSKDLKKKGATGSSQRGTRKAQPKQDTSRAGLQKRWEETSSAVVREDVAIADKLIEDDVLPTSDIKKVLALLETGAVTRDKAGIAAERYLSMYPNPEEGLFTALFDLTARTPQFKKQKGMTDAQVELRKGTSDVLGARAIIWARNNLSSETQQWMNTTIASIRTQLEASTGLNERASRTETAVDVNKRRKQADVTIEQIKKELRENNDMVNAFGKISIPPEVFAMLQGSTETYKPRRDKGKTAFESYLASVRNNIDPDTNEVYTAAKWRTLTVLGKGGKTAEAKAAADKADSWLLKQYADFEFLFQLGFALEEDSVVGADLPLHPIVVKAVKQGNLEAALAGLANTSASRQVQKIAAALAANIGSTKLITKKNLKTDDGFTKLAGYFDPETNTIALDEKTGINAHALLHEMLHAVTSATIADKLHPLTKKLNKIFEGVKEQLAGEYGVTNLDEFVAEALANPDFQTQLKTTTVNGETPWKKLTLAISNFFRTLQGLSQVPETSTFDAVDKLVQEIIAPTYNSRAATKIYMTLGTPNGPQKLLNNQASSNAFDTTTKEGMASYLKQGQELMSNVTVPVAAKNVWINLQPASILGQLAESRIPGATKLNVIINRMSATLRAMNDSTDVIVNDIKELRRDGLSKLQRLKGEISTDFKFLRDIGPIASAYRVDPRVGTFEKAYGHKANYFDPETNKTVPNLNYDPEVAKKIYKELRADYLAMTKEGRDLYSIITNAFAKSLVDVDTAVAANLAATINDEAAVKRIRKKLAVYLALERGTITPFMPMIRDGDYRLGYFAVDPRTGQPMYFTEYFKTTKQRKRAIEAIDEYNKEELAKISDTTRRNKIAAQVNIPMEIGIKESKGNYGGAPNDSFVGKVFAVLKAEGANEDTVNGILDLVLDSMPERSLMQSLRIRRDVRGFKGDVTPSGTAGDKRVFGLIDDSFDLIGTVQSKGRDYNRQIVQMTYGAELQQFERDVLETDKLDSKTIDGNTKMYKVALGRIANFAKSPDIPKWSQSLNAAGYAWTMGWNFSSAAITPFDVAMSVAPRLMGKYGDAKALKALGTAAAILANSPKTRTVQVMQEDGTMGTRQIKTGGAGFSGGNYNFEEIKAMSKQDIADAKMKPELQATLVDIEIPIKRFTENGQINQSLNQEELDMNNAKDVLEKINSWTSYLFHHAERYNRELTLIATTILELDRLRTNPRNDKEKSLTDLERKELVSEVAIVETELTLGSIASAGRPVFAQKGVGNVLMLFKRFAIAKYHMMATMTNDAFPRSGGTPEAKENRRIAQHQLARFLVSTGLFAGVAGMPLMGALGQLYDLFVEDDEDDFDAMLRKITGEPFYKGLVNEALGADVASRISLNSLLYRPPIIDKDQPGLYTLIEQFAGPLMGIYMSMDRGYDLFSEGEVFKGVQAVLPAAARNVLKSGEQFSTGEVSTRRGDAVVEDIGVTQILLQFGGFANAELIKQYDYNKNERRKVAYIGKQRTKLLRKANIAASNRDREAYRQVMEEIKEYNRGLPRAARDKNIILPKTISRSRKSFVTRTGKMIGGIEYTPLMLESLKQYDQGLQLFD